MSKDPDDKKQKYDQDAFDKAFLKVLHEVQSLGFAKNVKKLEEHLKIPFNTIYQVRNGSRGIPKQFREKVSRFFIDKYDVNPKVFENVNAKVFRHDPPVLEEVDEEYLTSDKNVTSGTLAELTKLRAENHVLKSKLEDKSVNYSLKTDAAYATRQVAFQEVVLDVLAGLSGTTFEELYAKMRIKESDLLRVASAGGNVYEHRK